LLPGLDEDELGPSTDFAFYNTVVDKFVEIAGEQDWDSKEQFLDACKSHKGKIDVERYLRLMPDWVPDA
jgi:hypothetical protein